MRAHCHSSTKAEIERKGYKKGGDCRCDQPPSPSRRRTTDTRRLPL